MVTWFRKRSAIAGGVAAICGLAIASLVAQDQPPVLLVLGHAAIDQGPPPHLIPPGAANDQVASVGLRDAMPYFAARIGESVTLPGGDAGPDGWFALRSVPSLWVSEPGSADGLQNYLLAGPGLGSPDDEGDRTSLLNAVADVVPVRATGLNVLVGRRVCAIVYGADVVVNPGTQSTADLSGMNLGVVAFQVTGVDASGPNRPAVTIRILDLHETCGGALAAFTEAPNVTSAP